MPRFETGNGKVENGHWTIVKSSERFCTHTSPSSLSFKFHNTSYFSATKETVCNYLSCTSGWLWGKLSDLPRTTGKWIAVGEKKKTTFFSSFLSCGQACAAASPHWVLSLIGCVMWFYSLKMGSVEGFLGLSHLGGSLDWPTTLKLESQAGIGWGSGSGGDPTVVLRSSFPWRRFIN